MNIYWYVQTTSNDHSLLLRLNSFNRRLRLWGYDDKMVSVFVVDATFVTDPAKFISGSLLALSAMISMQLPHVNVLSKCDLIEEASMDRVLEMESALQLWDVLGNHGGNSNNSLSNVFTYLDPSEKEPLPSEVSEQQVKTQERENKWNRLTEAICSLLDDYSMVGFIPLNINEEDSIAHVLATVDHAINYGEDLEVKGADYDDFDGGEEE